MPRTGTATAVCKWGNSAGVRIPKEFLKEAQLHEGDQLVMEVEAPGVIRLRIAEEVLTLEKLLAGMKPGRREELDWGPPRGKEVW